ncbi:uncharacterized protein LOC131232497 isoform X2 [Magnolia sinica]|uniref:uncharacterized protein LOC131232497 isoform X2 n=1 Tax=Magnolia sinica TaxID=86752 RepID=UPI00265B5374|nr:uncharacterized protein LOC131232497 isoform X2 [Magnolia sinica]
MRVLSYKFHCPSFICFCKSSALPIFSPCPLKLENTHHVSSAPDAVGQLPDEKEKVEADKERVDGEVFEVEDDVDVEFLPKSSLKKPVSGSDPKEVEKGRVQWMDFLGKELVEIREFEPSESGESEDGGDGNRGCVCVIQ